MLKRVVFDSAALLFAFFGLHPAFDAIQTAFVRGNWAPLVSSAIIIAVLSTLLWWARPR